MAGKQDDGRVVEALFALVRSGLWESPSTGDFLLSDAEWKRVFELSKEQTVTGLAGRGIALLPDSVYVPDSTMIDFMMETERIKRASEEVVAARDTLLAAMDGAGLHPIVLKGPSVAEYYSEPLLRVSGDLDVFVDPEEWDACVQLIESKGLKTESAPDGSLHYTWGNVEVDQHRSYFDLHCKPELLPLVPSPCAELLMLSSHILKHCISAGVGLRQLCDIAIAYKSVSYDKAELLSYYKSLGLVRWNRLLDAFLAEYLGAEDLPYGPGVSPRPLAKIILNGGNFGFYATGRHEAVLGSSKTRRKLNTFSRMLARLPFSLKYSARETFATIASLVKGNL